jgi:hypothetical protein
LQEKGGPDEPDIQPWLKAEGTWLEEHRPKKKRNPSKSVTRKENETGSDR